MSEVFDENILLRQFINNLKCYQQKAEEKKQEHLQKIMQIFREFVSKSQIEIDRIIQKKIQKLEHNYHNLVQYIERQKEMSTDQRKLIITEFLVKPFEKFPFSGNKNEKIFKEQYNLIQKASRLIEQTLVDSFNEQQIPNFDNLKFFETINNHGLGQQSLIKFNLSPQNFVLEQMQQLLPLQKNIKNLKMMGEYLVLIGDQRFIEIWDLEYRVCFKKLYMDALAPISYLGVLQISDAKYLAIGFGDLNPSIWIYRTDNWQIHGCASSHTRAVTKIIQAKQLILSGSVDGNVCIYSFDPFNQLSSSPHISSVEDLIVKNNLVYVLLKCSSLCEYQLQQNGGDVIMQFRRTLSTGFISMIRFTEVGSNFTGVACHIYGLSQIEITRKIKIQESNIINVSQMIADFVVIESKLNSQYYAVCAFQNSSSMRIYSLKTGEAIYQISSDYMGEVGVAGYLPKIQIAEVNQQYYILVINQSEFETGNTIRVYRLTLK